MKLEYVIKRNRELVRYSLEKITKAILAAGEATKEFGREQADTLAHVTQFNLQAKFADPNVHPTVEDIQDQVETALMQSPFKETAKAFIIYRKEQADARRLSNEENANLMHSYVKKLDWNVKENANMCYSLQGLNNFIAGDVTRKYWLNQIYTDRIREAHENGDLHIHDLDQLSVYCCGWSLEDLLLRGFSGVPGKVESFPPKHFRSALGQAVNFLYTLQGEAAGAQAFSSFDTLMAPFIREDNLNYSQVKQAIQEFVFNINTPTRVGFQCMSADTEILTPSGWVGYRDLAVGDVIKTFNIEKEVIEDKPTKRVFFGEYEGAMYNLLGGTQDQLVSPKHRVVWSKKEASPEWGKDPIEDVLSQTNQFWIPGGADYAPEFIYSVDRVQYKGVIWCPNTDNETVIARRNGKVFITGNTPFTNVTLDLNPPSTLEDTPAIIGGEYRGAPYKDYQEEMNTFNNAFAEVMMEGDSKGRVHTFPIPTINITPEFDWENSNLDKVWQMTGKYGIPYFANFVNSDMNAEDARSMCPLHPDTEVIVSDSSLATLCKRIEDVYRNTKRGTKCNVMHKGEWYPAELTATKSEGCRTFKLRHSTSITMDVRHEQPIKQGPGTLTQTIEAKEIEVGMYLPFNGYMRPRPAGDAFHEDGYWWFPVKEITEQPDYSDTVYCFVVDSDEHLFQLANGLVTHNCRLRIDNRELEKRGGGLFGSNPLTGSTGVVTLNLPRIAYFANDIEDFKARLRDKAEIARDALETKRPIIEEFMEKNLYPYSRFYLDNVKKRTGKYWANHFSTIGIIGMNEACTNFMGNDIGSDMGQAFATSIMDFMRELLLEFQKETGNLYNLEASPAEGATTRLALADKALEPAIQCANEVDYMAGATPYYTNSTHLPVNYTDDMFEALSLQDELQTKYTGGTVVHLFLGEAVTDIDTVRNLVRKVSNNYKLPYFSLTPTFSICREHGYLMGEHKQCPMCGGPVEVYSRIVGYLRPVEQWNAGKQAEYHNRVPVIAELAEQAAQLASV